MEIYRGLKESIDFFKKNEFRGLTLSDLKTAI